MFKVQVDKASLNDFTSSLAPMHGLGLIQVTGDDYDFFTESNDPKHINRILKVMPTFFCINNNHDENTLVYKMLDRYLQNVKRT